MVSQQPIADFAFSQVFHGLPSPGDVPTHHQHLVFRAAFFGKRGQLDIDPAHLSGAKLIADFIAMSAAALCDERKVTPRALSVIRMHNRRVVCCFLPLNLIVPQQPLNRGAVVENAAVGIVENQIVGQIFRQQLVKSLTLGECFLEFAWPL